MPRRSGSIPGLPCAWDVHASLGLCRSLLPLAFDLEKSPDIVGARLTARATRAHPTSSWHWSRIGMGLLCAQKVLATSGILRIVNARPGARTRLRSTGRPLPAYSRRLESLQAARSLCHAHAYGMHASRWQQQACVWNAASGGMCVRYHGDHCDPSEVAAPNGVRLQPVGIIWVYPASPLTTGRRDVRGRPR
jgi:hypothetical protein